MTFEFLCKYCEERNVWDNQIFPDSNYCKICHKNQNDESDVNWKESDLKLWLRNGRFFSK